MRDCVLTKLLNLSLEFEFCDFFHVSRKANTLAHNFAKYECVVGESRI